MDQHSPPVAGSRGAPDRVAHVHAQARLTLGAAMVFALAAPVTAVLPHSTGSWLPLHLFLVGGLLTAISGATQLFAVTWSASPAPTDRMATLQRWAVAGGAGTVALGRELGSDPLTAVGGLGVTFGLGLLATILVRIRREAVTDRFFPAIDAYLVALAFGLLGVLLGIGLAVGSTGDAYTRLRGAHLTVNVFGLVGIVIVGTLPFFVATQTRTKMSPLVTASRLRMLVGGLAVATAASAVGRLVDRPGLAAAGLAAYAVGIVGTVGLVPLIRRRQLDWAGPRLVQLATGVAWWAVTTGLLAGSVLGRTTEQDLALHAMVVGGFAQILVASLSYLGPVLRGGGHRSLSSGFALTGSWLSVVAANVAAVGALTDRVDVMGWALGVWVVDAALRGARLVLHPPQRPAAAS